jgi:RNA polymerase sigma-70 factor (ECF subfamily)
MTSPDWERLHDRFAPNPTEHVEVQELIGAVRVAVERELTPRQREVFVAIIIEGVPADSLARRLGTTRGAIYKVMFDARRNLRLALAAQGHLSDLGAAEKSTLYRGLVNP